MPETKEKINYTYRMDPARHEEIRVLAARRRSTIQSLIDDGIHLIEQQQSQPPAKLPDEWDELTEKLQQILTRGTEKLKQDARQAIRSNYNMLDKNEQDSARAPHTRNRL